MKARRALDSEPCFPLNMPYFVYLSKSTWANFLPAGELRRIKGPKQSHIPMRWIGNVHTRAGKPTGRIRSSFLPPAQSGGVITHTQQLNYLWALPCFSFLSSQAWPLLLSRCTRGLTLAAAVTSFPALTIHHERPRGLCAATLSAGLDILLFLVGKIENIVNKARVVSSHKHD